MPDINIKDTIQPTLSCEWNDIFNNESYIHQLENQLLPSFLRKCRWFGGKSRMISAIKIPGSANAEARRRNCLCRC